MFLVYVTTKGTNTGENYTFFADGIHMNSDGRLEELAAPTSVLEMMNHGIDNDAVHRITFTNTEVIAAGSTFISIGTGTNGWQTTVVDPSSRAVVAVRG